MYGIIVIEVILFFENLFFFVYNFFVIIVSICIGDFVEEGIFNIFG